MYEDFYGLREKPFSLTPDPRYFYRSQSHANALELVQHGIRNREGLVVVTGTSGAGKTTLCRTILDGLDPNTFTALVLNPYVSGGDLVRIILQDFGVISREEIRRGRLAGVHTNDLIHTLHEFLFSLLPLGARALLIIDEAQKLPLSVLEQVKALSELVTGNQAPMQIALVGQLSLQEGLRAPALRQLDERVSIRYRLRPLTEEETAAYVAHRLTVAGGGSMVTFTPMALQRVHWAAGGNPRLINLVCDRAMLSSFSVRATRIEPDAVIRAANGLGLKPMRSMRSMTSMGGTLLGWMRRRVAAL